MSRICGRCNYFSSVLEDKNIGLCSKKNIEVHELNIMSEDCFLSKQDALECITLENSKEWLHENYGTYKAEFVKKCGLPYFDREKWVNVSSASLNKVVVSKTIANKIKQPVQDTERIVAFKRVKNGYCPLFERFRARVIGRKYYMVIHLE